MSRHMASLRVEAVEDLGAIGQHRVTARSLGTVITYETPWPPAIGDMLIVRAGPPDEMQ